MPNWCSNKLTLEAEDDSELKKFIDKNKYDPSILSFSKSVPVPDNIFQGSLGTKERELHGSNNWYDWNTENWGTKWDCSDIEIDIDEDHIVTYTFQTPWGPPLPWITKTSELYPNINFCLEFAEEGMDFAGHHTVNAGSIEESEEYKFSESVKTLLDKDKTIYKKLMTCPEDDLWRLEEEICQQYKDKMWYINEYHVELYLEKYLDEINKASSTISNMFIKKSNVDYENILNRYYEKKRAQDSNERRIMMGDGWTMDQLEQIKTVSRNIKDTILELYSRKRS